LRIPAGSEPVRVHTWLRRPPKLLRPRLLGWSRQLPPSRR
jgi:hypothetical protein